jgi:hypothetical protein
LGAGDHTVIFEYTPLSFSIGAWLTMGAASLLAALLIAAAVRKGRAT